MQVFINGGRHVQLSKKSDRVEIEKKLDGGIDVIFEESGSQDHADSEKWRNIASSPVLFIGLWAYTAALKLLGQVLASDSDMNDSISADHDTDRINVDRSVHSLISEGRKLWAVSNYSVAIFPGLALLSGNIPVFSFFLAIAVVSVFTAFIAGTVITRNMTMVVELERIARNSDYESAVLNVGEQHVVPIESLIERYAPSVTIV